MMTRGLCCLLVISFVTASGESLSPDVQEAITLVDETETGAGALYWRARSLVKVPLEGWVLSKVQMFTTQDGSGDAATGEPISSSYRGMSDVPAGTEFKTENAFDGSEDTVWESEDGEPGQWIGIKFAEPTDIQSMVMRTPDMVKGPSGVMIEKSEDGESWGRVVEITDMKNWGVQDQLYKFVPMDQLPPSVFSIRSQKDTSLCVGVRTRMENPDDEDSAIIDIEDDAVLEFQKCLDDTVTQWWSFDPNRGLLHNAKDAIWIASLNGTLAEGTNFVTNKCTDGCPEATDNEFMYSDSIKGGFLRSKTINNLVVSPKGELKAGAEVVLGTCGDDPNMPASLDVCPDNKESQFELLPMFALEPEKEAIKCAPYSHTLQEPSAAASRQEAQRLCAADIKCSAYSWVDNSGEELQDRVYLCYALHDVHSGQVGWELGVRAGRAYDSPYEKKEL
jgi:hypothetical protein